MMEVLAVWQHLTKRCWVPLSVQGQNLPNNEAKIEGSQELEGFLNTTFNLLDLAVTDLFPLLLLEPVSPQSKLKSI